MKRSSRNYRSPLHSSFASALLNSATPHIRTPIYTHKLRNTPFPTDHCIGGGGCRDLILFQLGWGCSQSTVEGELGANALDAVEGVQVLVHDDLVAGATALARYNDGEGKEELPDAVPPVAILGTNLLFVALPVSVPPPESSTVVNCKISKRRKKKKEKN